MDQTGLELEKYSRGELIEFARRGILKVNMIGVYVMDDLPEYKQFKSLAGHPISLSEASRKYGITQSLLSRYIKLGKLQPLGKHKNQTLVDESICAYLAYIIKRNRGAGKRYTNPDLTPYIKKT